MKVKGQKHSLYFKAMILVVAFAISLVCFPISEIFALAASLNQYTDYSYMTIGNVDDEVSTTVTKGQTYRISNGYVGGKSTYVVGRMAKDTVLGSGATLQSSKVTVSYSALNISGDGEGSENKVTVYADTSAYYDDYYGEFIAEKVGTYTITYSYSYTVGEDTYTNSYEFKVESEISNATLEFDNNQTKFIPSVIDLKLAKDGETYDDLYLPTPTVTDENGEVVESVTFVKDKKDITATGSCILVTATGANQEKVTLSGDAENLYVDGDAFKSVTLGAQKYTFEYSYYLDGQFIAKTTKSTEVYSEENPYYTDYELKLDLATDWTDKAQTGVEVKLPAAKGVTAKDSQSVDVSYSVKVLYKTTNSDKTWVAISADEYGADVVKANGELVDSTKFKPLKDGWYTFVYTITDIYGNEKSSDVGFYQFTNIKDETNPTPVIYDASVAAVDGKNEDASSKLATKSVANGVVVYAIGMEDNVSKAGDENVELTRKIMTSDTVTKVTIDDYDAYNLVFNYRSTANDAYINLQTNNYLIRKQTTSVSSDTEMLNWLAAHGYKIVVDNANYKEIYKIFNDESFFATIDSVTNEASALAWFKTEDATSKGFAYINCDQTFGASSSTEGGMGTGTYYIHYIAKDAAGNSKDVSKSMYVGPYTDDEAPEIKFSTTLASSYLPNSTITFDVPTASDNGNDANMAVKTLYRYRDVNKNVITVADTTKVDLDNLWTDIAGKKVEGVLLTDKFADYHSTEDAVNDGYIDLTDASASSYKINLKEAGDTAVELQILVYAYDDAGNANIYAQTINISNSIDSYPPRFRAVNSDNFRTEYKQGAEIELPSFVVADDAVAYMNYDVNVYYLGVDGTSTREKVATYDSSARNNGLANEYIVNGGKFIAARAGKYQASISVKDSNNKTVVTFVNYDVEGRTVIQPPVLNTSLESKTIELGETIEIVTPSVSYDIPNSVTYDQFVKGATTAEYVVLGVNENGSAADGFWSAGGPNKGSYKAEKVETINVQYEVNMYVYKHSVFTYNANASVWDETAQDYKNQSAFTFNGATVELKDGQIVLNDSGLIYVISKDAEGNVTVTEDGSAIDDYTGTILDGQEPEKWFDYIRSYTLTSDLYTINVEDTKGPALTEYDYVQDIATSEIPATGYALNIYGIQATDLSKIDESNSKVVISWKLANGETGSHDFRYIVNDTTYTIKGQSGNNLDGTYTVKYTVYDEYNNYTTKEYVISVGDNAPPTLKFEDDFVADSFEIDSDLTIDLDKITFSDGNKAMPSDAEPVITLKNTSTDETIELTKVSNTLVCKLDEVGSYTLTVEIEDAVGNKTTETFNFEVTAKAENTEMTYQIIGTVLIVISVLVLVGVIVYFVVSKVKLDKELKK